MAGGLSLFFAIFLTSAGSCDDVFEYLSANIQALADETSKPVEEVIPSVLSAYQEAFVSKIKEVQAQDAEYSKATSVERRIEILSQIEDLEQEASFMAKGFFKALAMSAKGREAFKKFKADFFSADEELNLVMKHLQILMDKEGQENSRMRFFWHAGHEDSTEKAVFLMSGLLEAWPKEP